VIVHVPNNMTDQFQPLDLNINGHAKEQIFKEQIRMLVRETNHQPN